MYEADEIDTTSRENVKAKGEVFTPFKIVSEMNALVPDSFWKNPDSCFLEPTSGNGQFLVKIFEKRINNGISIETALNTMIGMEINKETLAMSHFRIYERVCAQMIVEGVKPQSKLWFEKAIQYVAIVRNNIFQVKDSLLVMADYANGKGKLAEKKFVFSDPTGNNDIMIEKKLALEIEKIKKNFRECKDGIEKKTLSPFFNKV